MVEISKYPMVEALVEELRVYDSIITGLEHTVEFGYDEEASFDIIRPDSTDRVIRKIKGEFDSLGPYHFAKSRNLLVNNSGEEFACQFMAFFNEYSGQQVY